jgi:hypothetical protein
VICSPLSSRTRILQVLSLILSLILPLYFSGYSIHTSRHHDNYDIYLFSLLLQWKLFACLGLTPVVGLKDTIVGTRDSHFLSHF